jgi:putative hydrolase of the HAD superfamily
VSAPVVLFDLFGVIAHHQPLTARERLAALADVPPPRFWDAYWAHRGGYDRAELPAADYWQRVAATTGTTFDARRTAALIEADIASWSTVDAGMVALVEGLAAAGTRIALLSNIPEDLAVHYERHHDRWLRRFEVAALSCRTGLSKPDPAAYQWCCDALGSPPEHILFIDDRTENLDAAARLGQRTHRFTGRAEAANVIAGGH